MSPISKGSCWPDQPGASPTTISTALMDQLETMLENEYEFTPNIQIAATQGQEPGDVTPEARDGSVNVLRCLKMWYDLSSDAFLISVNIVDCFLTKMKVRNKHISCISISGLYIASKLLNESLDPNDLVTISQSKCTATDLERMAGIIIEKLNLKQPNAIPLTALAFLRLFHKLFDVVAEKLNITEAFRQNINEQELCMYLEIIACDYQCVNFRPSVIAFVLMCIHFEDFYVAFQYFPMEMCELNAFTAELKQFCNITDDELLICMERIISVVNLYNGELPLCHRQRLTWKVSTRTMRKLRPTRQLQYVLPTINEDNNNIAANLNNHSNSQHHSYH